MLVGLRVCVLGLEAWAVKSVGAGGGSDLLFGGGALWIRVDPY